MISLQVWRIPQEKISINTLIERTEEVALSRSSHMSEALPLSENKYAEFYEIDKPMIQFADGVNEIQHAQ